MDQTPNYSKLMKLANSSSGQHLFQILQANSSDTLRSAINQAAAGNYMQAQKLLGPLLELPEVKAFIKQLEDNNG